MKQMGVEIYLKPPTPSQLATFFLLT